MDKISVIKISSECDDILITDGEYINIINGLYSYKNGVLEIKTTEDLKLVLPKGQYESIIIQTEAGDAKVNLSDSEVEKIEFNSECGDLVIDGFVKQVYFNSPAGEYIRKNGFLPRKNSKFTQKTAKTVLPELTSKDEDWVDGERYK